MVKVLVVNTVNTDPNGIVQVIFNYNEHIDHKDIIVDLISINNPAQHYYNLIEKHGGRIFVLNRTMRNTFVYVWKLIKIIRYNKFDIIHAHGNSSTLLLEMIAGLIGGCKNRIAHSHNTTCDNPGLHQLLKPLFNMLCTDRFACGEKAGKWLFGKKVFTVVNNGIDTEKYKFNPILRNLVREKLKVNENQILIGNVGFFNRQKNQIFLLEVFKKVVEINKNYKLILIGDGPDRDKVYDTIKRLNLSDNIILTGLITNVQDYLSAIDIIVMPSLYEGLPLALIEEQANGLQCIVSDSITKEVDKTGNISFLSLSSKKEDWASKITNVCVFQNRMKQSLEAIRSIKDCGYDIQTESKKIENFYLSKSI